MVALLSLVWTVMVFISFESLHLVHVIYVNTCLSCFRNDFVQEAEISILKIIVRAEFH